MKSIKVLAPLSQAALLLEMRSRENYPGRAERRLSARRRASLCETCREHRMGPPPPRVSRQSGGGLGGTDKEPRGAEVRGPCQAPRSEAVPELAARGGSDAGGRVSWGNKVGLAVGSSKPVACASPEGRRGAQSGECLCARTSF